VDIPQTPSELGFKYKSWRKYQKEIIQNIVDRFENGYDVALLELPTGSGKSLIAMSILKLMAEKGYIVVSSKSLQNQYMRDFGVPTVKGRSNFKCLIVDKTCDKGPCIADYECPVKYDCPYYVQKQIAMNAPYSIHNYAYYLTAFNYTDSWDIGDIVVFDECHTMDSHLTDMVNVSLKKDDLKRFGIGMTNDYISMVDELADRVEVEMAELRAEIVDDTEDGLSYNDVLVEEYERLRKLYRKLRFLLNNYTEDNWIVEDEKKVIRFRPIWTDAFSYMFFNHGRKFLLMSATIGNADKFMKVVGIDRYFDTDRVFVIRAPSLFDVARRPAMFVPIIRFVYSNKEKALSYMVYAIDKIIEMESGKGIIHAVSYEYARYIVSNSKYKHRMLFHLDSNGRDIVIDRFIDSEDGILVSPSVHTGLDFRDDLARWQIIVKVPYASLGDEVVRRRAETDRDWYIQDAIVKIVQAYGRIVRNENDYGRTYILDSEFYRLLMSYRSMFPKWFLDAVKIIRLDEVSDEIDKHMEVVA